MVLTVLPSHLVILTTNASLLGWGGVLSILSLQVICSSVLFPDQHLATSSDWTILLEGHLIWIQSDNTVAITYINQHGGNVTVAAQVVQTLFGQNFLFLIFQPQFRQLSVRLPQSGPRVVVTT